jgi:hypothetical protein
MRGGTQALRPSRQLSDRTRLWRRNRAARAAEVLALHTEQVGLEGLLTRGNICAIEGGDNCSFILGPCGRLGTLKPFCDEF